MNNIYDKILSDKLGSMEAMPPEGLWNNIQNQMGAEAAFDKTLSDKLSPHTQQPPANIWNNIAAALFKHSIPFYQTSIFRRIAVASFALIGLGLILIYQNSDNQLTVNTPAQDEQVLKPATSASDQVSLPTQSQTEAKPVTNTNSNIVSKTKNNSLTNSKPVIYSASQNSENTKSETVQVKEVFINEDENSISIANQPLVFPIEQPEIIKVISTDNQEVAENKPTNQQIVEPNTSTQEVKIDEQKVAELHLQISVADTNSTPKTDIDNIPLANSNQSIDPGTLPRNPRNLNKFGLNLHYIPSIIYNGAQNLNQNDINLTFSYQNINFKADLGFGVGLSHETAEFTVDYTRYEFVKIQYVTDSLGFTYDPVSQTYIPVPFGHHEKVYDDVKYSYTAEATTRNLWLNIPFNFGYIKNYKKVSLMAGAGINYSMMLSKTISGMFEPDNQTTVKSLYYPVKTRLNTSISYNLTAGVGYRFREELMLSGEFYGNYYQNPIYNGSEMRPYGFGIRVGLTYFFL